MEIVSNIALISINETTLVQIVSFLVFLLVINRVMFRPLRETMAEREGFIEGIHQDIAAAGQELDTLLEKMRRQEAAARDEAQQVKSALEAAAGQEAATVLAAARQDVAALSRNTEQDIARMLSAAQQAIDAETKHLAVSIMEKLMGRKVGT